MDPTGDLASLMLASWNQVVPGLRQIDRLRRAGQVKRTRPSLDVCTDVA